MLRSMASAVRASVTSARTRRLLGEALRQVGFSLIQRFRTVEPEDADADLLVVLGGGMGAYEEDRHPFLSLELALLRERLSRGRPNLGICLGAHVLAKAAGADVYRGSQGFEVGVAPVRWGIAAREDPVLAALEPGLLVAHWHEDTFSPVPGATLLASTPAYPQQVFRLGPGSTYGFQFHLELTAEALAQWLDVHEATLLARGKDMTALRTQLPAFRETEPVRRALCLRLARHFAQPR